MNFNKVILAGHLTRAVELNQTDGGTDVAKFALAVNDDWIDRDGQKQPRVCFIECVHFGKRAIVLHQFLKKGSPLLLEGRLEFQQWLRDDEKRSRHVVIVSDFEFVGGKDGDK